MDAVNVDLDEMRARVDSTHSIITSRQRVEVIKSLGVMTLVLQSAVTRGKLKFTTGMLNFSNSHFSMVCRLP